MAKNNYTEDFEAFWRKFPNRAGKFAAAEKYVLARKRATAQELLDGVARYIQHKPDYQAWCHPKTWLSQGRWLDEAPAKAPASANVFSGSSCQHQPPCERRSDCVARTLGRVSA